MTDMIIYDQLTEQWELSIEQQRSLIKSEKPLSDNAIATAVAIAKQNLLPLTGVNVIPSRNGINLFVNSDGIRWRVHTDPRKVQQSVGEVVHTPTPEEPWIHARAVIQFGDGSHFVNEAWIWLRFNENTKEFEEKSRGGNWYAVNLGDRMMAAITKAKRRCGVDAVGVTLPIFEDAAMFSSRMFDADQVVDVEAVIIEEKEEEEELEWLP